MVLYTCIECTTEDGCLFEVLYSKLVYVAKSISALFFDVGATDIKDPGTALMETKPIQVYTNENRL